MKYVVIFLILLSWGCSRPAPEQKCGFILNSNNDRISWKGQFVSVTVDQSFYPEYEEATKKAIDTWNQAIGHNVLIYKGKNDNPTIRLIKDWQDNPIEESATHLHWQDTQIQSYEVEINTQYYQYFVNFYWSSIDLESLLVHELGHVLGLDHIEDEIPSVMNPELMRGQLRRNLTQVDITNIRCEY